MSRRRVYDYIEQLHTAIAGRQGVHVLPIICDRTHYELCWNQNNEDGNVMGGGPNSNTASNRIELQGYRCTQFKSTGEYTISNDSNMTQKVVIYWCKFKRNVVFEQDTNQNNPIWDESLTSEENIRAFLNFQAAKETSTGDPLSLPFAGPFHGDSKKTIKCYKTQTVIMKHGSNYSFRSSDFGRKTIDYDYHVSRDSGSQLSASADIFRNRSHFCIARVMGQVGAAVDAVDATAVSTAKTQISVLCKRTLVFGFTSPHKNYSEIRGSAPNTEVDITHFNEDVEEIIPDA